MVLVLTAAGFAALATRAFGRTRIEGIGAGPFVPLGVLALVLVGVTLMILAGAYE